MTDSLPMQPCPFCGSDTCETSLSRWNPVMDRWRVVCGRGCHAEGPATDSEDEAIAAWNQRSTRPTPASPPGLVEALDTALFECWEALNRPALWPGSASLAERLAPKLAALSTDARVLPIEGEAVAWLHTLHMEHGQTMTRILDHRANFKNQPERTAFGLPGREYDAEYTVTCEPLFRAATDEWQQAIEAAAKKATCEILGYKDWGDATDYRTTGRQDAERDRVHKIVLAALTPTGRG